MLGDNFSTLKTQKYFVPNKTKSALLWITKTINPSPIYTCRVYVIDIDC